MKARTGYSEIMGLSILGAIGVVLLVGFLVYVNNADKKASAERRAAENARFELEQAEKAEQARKRLAADEEYARKKKEAQLEREREDEARAVAERERKRKLEEAEKERQRKVADMAKWRSNYIYAAELFQKKFALAKVAPADERLAGASGTKAYYYAFDSYQDDKAIYEVKTESGKIASVEELHLGAEPKPVDLDWFRRKIANGQFVYTTGKGVWLSGVDSPAGKTFRVPERGDDFRLSKVSLGSLYETIDALGVKYPNIRFRLTLKSESGKTNIVIGSFDYDEIVERVRFEEAIGKKIAASAKRSSMSASKPKKKVFKRTVVLYDGVYIKKEMGGITKVPREYNYIGTTRLKSDDYRAEREFRQKWQALYDEAVRQEKLAEEAEAEYAAQMKVEAAQRDSENARASALAEDETTIDTALQKCSIVVQLDGSKASAPKSVGNSKRR